MALLFLLCCIHLILGVISDSNIGHLTIKIDPHLTYILCSLTVEQKKDSELQLLNINDVLNNKICVESSYFDLSSQHLVLKTNPLRIIKMNKDEISEKEKENVIDFISVETNSYHLKIKDKFISIEFIQMTDRKIPKSPHNPQLLLSSDDDLKFSFIPIAITPFSNRALRPSNTETSDISANADEKIQKIFPRIGKRVKIENKFGIITRHIDANNSYFIQFNDGSIGYYDNIDFDSIHIEYPIGANVDAYWPADRLKLTSLMDVKWPATIVNYSNISDSYTLKYEDGSVHPSIPSIYIFYPQMPCVDDRNECPVLAKNQQCRLNPSFAMIHCRKSCRVCKHFDADKNDKNKNEENDLRMFEYFRLSIDGDKDDILDDSTLIYESSSNINSIQESKSLNEIGETLMKRGDAENAEQYFLRASYLGNNDAKFNLAHIYTVSDTKKDDKAILYLYFGALGGSSPSNMALGYRHLYGYGVPKSCQVSAQYYQKAANVLFGSSNSLFNPMETQHIEMIRLHDVNRRDLPIKETEEVIRFYHNHADNGDAAAQMALGQLYYYGLRGFDQNFKIAINYFEAAAKQNNGDAFSMLGNIYMDGIDELNITKNIETAISYYQKAIDEKSTAGYTGMAFLYLEGIPDKRGKLVKDTSKAFDYFKIAAKRQDLSAIFYLGLMHFNGIGVKQKSFGDAFECFMSAARRGHAQSLYYAGFMHLNGLVTAKSCKMAVELFKMAAERTVVAKELSIARSFYLDANYDSAYYLYSKLAIQGFEIAQSNVGWLLKRNLVSKELLYTNEESLKNESNLLFLSRKSAFQYFEWSATQNNADSQRVVGDYYYYNYLETEQNETSRFGEAGHFYELAAENQLTPNAQSMFNLGYMHQYGIGRKKDFEMAKRFYDLSKSSDPNGNVACYICLAMLYFDDFQFSFFGIGSNKKYYFSAIYDTYSYYTEGLTAENASLILLIAVLIIVLWIRN